MARKWWIDFSGYVCVEAETTQEAESLFWSTFVKDCPKPFYDDVWDADTIEERIDEPLLEPVYGVPTTTELEDFWNKK